VHRAAEQNKNYVLSLQDLPALQPSIQPSRQDFATTVHWDEIAADII
jgi:hypothetical protein